MNYKEALDYMQQIGQYGISPGLDSIRQLVGRLGNPQKGMRYVHVAGTNGKGSVCAYVSSVLQRGGYRVGKYTSPPCGGRPGGNPGKRQLHPKGGGGAAYGADKGRV